MVSVARQIFFGAIALAVGAYGCAPQQRYRRPLPPNDGNISAPRFPPAPPPAPVPPPELARKPLPQEGKIREQDLKSKSPAPNIPGRDGKDSSRPSSPAESSAAPESTPAPLPDDSSLLAKITPGISPQRAASLRLTDEGSKLLDAGEAAKALTRLERTIVIDSTNPYGYFYLAKAQYRLGRYRESLNFLDIVEPRLRSEPFWMAEVQALRGDNYRALGQVQRAEASYVQSLRFNSGNRSAADGLSRLQGDPQSVNK
jgi:hypothetical protein